MNWIPVLLAVFLLTASPASAAEQENCTVCHKVLLTGKHERLPCSSCHGGETDTLFHPSSLENRAGGCVGCHPGYDALFDQGMAKRAEEKAFVQETFGRGDHQFFAKNCQGCHVTDCLDCHGKKGHAIASPGKLACIRCHKGYYVGADYFGMAPREDSLRYQRGKTVYGETYLTMLPDVHAEAQMKCGECHSMASLAAGERASKRCRDCHCPSEEVIEHSIGAHRESLECYACHSAWAPQEYGTFYVRLVNSPENDFFRVKREAGSEYIKSAYLKKQERPPLGVNLDGKVSPIRPQFIALFSDIRDGKVVGEENRLLRARWKAFFPHTVRSGTLMCDGCHNDPRRFLLEKEETRIYLPQKDGLPLSSFWSQAGQEVGNGSFMTAERFARMASGKEPFAKAYVEKWKKLINTVEDSSE